MSSTEQFDTAPEFANTAEQRELDTANGDLFAGTWFWVDRHTVDAGTHGENQLIKWIVAHGGRVCTSVEDLNKTDAPQKYVVSTVNHAPSVTVTPEYVVQCIDAGSLLDPTRFAPPDLYVSQSQSTSMSTAEEPAPGTNLGEMVNPSGIPEQVDDQIETVITTPQAPIAEEVQDAVGFQAANSLMSRKAFGGKSVFTEEEDKFIMEVVRKNPTRRTTHTLFDEISQYVPNHTGNSIRHRFRVYLSKHLDYVYQVDETGRLVHDDDGNLIKTKIFPQSIKKKFTAEEDYALAIAIKKQFYRDLFQVDPDTGRSLITSDDSPSAVAKRKLMMAPDHVPGTEPTFGEYRAERRRGPISREFFRRFAEANPIHSENAWRDRFRKFLLNFGVDEYINYYEGKVATDQVPEPMKNLTNRQKTRKMPAPGNYNSAQKKAKLMHAKDNDKNIVMDTQGISRSNPIPENELLDEDTMNFISSIKNDLCKIENSNDGFPTAENPSSRANVVTAGNVKSGIPTGSSDTVQSNDVPFEYPQDIADAIRNDFNQEEAQYDNIDPNMIPFPPTIATMDRFLPQFFQFYNTQQFINKVNEVISRDYEPTEAEKLVQDLADEAGVRVSFSTSILTTLSGDLIVFPRYFLNMFKDNVNPPKNVPGIWTPEDDEMLKQGRPEIVESLIKKHGSARVEMRCKFIERDLI